LAGQRLPGEESRARLIEAAARIINEQGYAALSAKTLAESVGLKRQIVHYYFRTMDELLLAVVRFYGELGLARFEVAFRSGDPFRVIWEVEADASATTFAFMAMARHQPIIRDELRRYLVAFQELQVQAIERYVREHDLTLSMPAAAAVVIIQSVAQSLAAQKMLGAMSGHAEALNAMEDFIVGLALSPST
jgi:AcrR family transcriptional regulator